MKKLSTFSFACATFTLSALGLQAQYNKANLEVASAVAEAKYSYDKLRIYPITANRVFLETHKSVGHYKPLKKGLEDGTVKIIERGAVTTAPATPQNTPDNNIAPNENNAPNDDARSNNQNDAHVLMHEQIQVTNLNVNQSARGNARIGLQNNNTGGGSDAVNTLYIQNTSKDTVFIMAGEVVKGGKQDRVIAQDMVIPPNSDLIDLSVFCVEKGRWTYGGADAADGFTGYANVSTNSVRKAAITQKEQSAVWQEVDKVTTVNGSSSSTHAWTALEKDKDYQQEMAAYESRFLDLPSVNPAVIGVVAVTGDRVVGCDMFATPDLFRNAYPDLLKSYISEAISSGAKVTITNADVDKYIARILENEDQQKDRVKENGQMFERNGVKMHISTF